MTQSRRVWPWMLGGVVVALLAGGVLLLVTGFPPGTALVRLVSASFGSRNALAQTASQSVPIMLCALGIALAARMGLWNIGAEGQLYMGALAAVAVFQYAPDLPAVVMLPAMALAGMCAGVLWILLPALLRARLGVSEILTTLMLNYVAVPISNYLLYGPWKSPTAFNFPVTRLFSDAAQLPILPGLPVHGGFLVAVAAAGLLHLVLWRTVWGYRVRVVGDNPRAASYAGLPVGQLIVQAFCISGALAGLAGMLQVSGVTHQMLPNFSPGFGYSALIVASLSMLSLAGTVVVSLLLAGLQVGSQGLQTVGVPGGISSFLQGLVLLAALAAMALSGRIKRRPRTSTNRGGGSTPE